MSNDQPSVISCRLAHIIHERFCCNRGSAATITLSTGRLAAQFFNVPCQVRVGPSQLRVPVAQRGCAILRRTAHEQCGLALPCQSAHFCTLDSGESSESCGIGARLPYNFSLKICILVKLHRLCCLSIGQCVRCCGTAWHWSLIHMIIHTSCTSFVDTESERADTLPHCRLSLCGALC